MSKIIAHCDAGLGNRMLHVANMIRISNMLGVDLKIKWKIGNHIGCARMEDIFDCDIELVDGFMSLPMISHPKRVSDIKPPCVVHAWQEFDANPKELHTYLQQLRPKKEIMEEAAEIVEKLPRPILGIHLREGDKKSPRDYSTIEITKYRLEEVAKKFDSVVYLTDGNHEIENALTPCHRSDPLIRNARHSIREALRDMMVLSMCDFILITVGTFGYCGALYNNIPFANIFTGEEDYCLDYYKSGIFEKEFNPMSIFGSTIEFKNKLLKLM